MPTFISTIKLTDQGIKEIHDTTKRASAFKSIAKSLGVKVIGQYWTLGRFDGLLIYDAPDDDTATAAMLKLGSLDYVKRHFGGYGYKAEDVSAQQIGFDLEVSNAKGVTLLKVAVKGTASGLPGFKLTGEERTASARDPLWRLLVVTDAGGPAAQHKIYKPSEMSQAPGFDPLG